MKETITTSEGDTVDVDIKLGASIYYIPLREIYKYEFSYTFQRMIGVHARDLFEVVNVFSHSGFTSQILTFKETIRD